MLANSSQMPNPPKNDQINSATGMLKWKAIETKKKWGIKIIKKNSKVIQTDFLGIIFHNYYYKVLWGNLPM